MDLNWCQYCEKQLEEASISSEDEDFNPMPSPVKANAKKHKTKSHSTRRNPPSTAKLNRSTSHRSASATTTATAAAAVVALVEAPIKKFQPWSGSYCSEECMQKDEQRSRLAIANLQTSNSTNQLAYRASSNAGSSSSNSHSVTSEDNPYQPTSYSRRSNHYETIRRNGRSALSLNLQRTSSQERGSSDSLASQNSPRQYSPSFPSHAARHTSSRSALRPMTPISTTFEEQESPRQPQEQRGKRDYHFSTTVTPEAVKEYARHARKSSASVATTKAGMVPSKSLAIPHLSQGLEGLAIGTMFSPRSPSVDEPAFYNGGKHRRSQASTSSIAYLSCSPSSSAESIMSSRSAVSSQSTAPSEGPQDYFSHRRTESGAHLSQATLQDYGLYASRPHRTPSSPALHGLLTGKSPPRPPVLGSTSYESQGTISKIIQAKAQQRYASSPDRRRRSVDNDLVPFPSAHDGFSAANRNPSFSSIKRTGSSASVTSLPHHFADSAAAATLPRNRSSVSVRNPGPLSPPYLTTVSSSAPKSWTWEGMPQYKAMESKGEKKRLFYFQDHNATPKVH